MKESTVTGRSVLIRNAFAVFAVLYGFTITAGFYQTGWISVFSTITFVLALFRLPELNNCYHEHAKIHLIGYLIIVWMIVNELINSISFWNSLNAIFEYRYFLFLPLVTGVFWLEPSIARKVLLGLLYGGGSALAGSYLLSFGYIAVEGAQWSFSNRVFHGFVISLLYCFALFYLLRQESHNYRTYLCAAIAVACFLNLLFIENGRTGYILAICISGLYLVMAFRPRNSIFFLVMFVVFCGFLGLTNDRLKSKVVNSQNDLYSFFSSGDVTSSVGQRAEFYSFGINAVSENFILGVGLSNMDDFLQESYDRGDLKYKTDNLHSEFLGYFLGLGVPGFLLFILYVFWFFKRGLELMGRSRSWSFLYLCVGTIFMISSLFHSVLKDFGEKHLLILVLAVVGALGPSRSNAIDTPKSNKVFRC